MAAKRTSMTRAELVSHIATETGLKKVEAEKALSATLSAVSSALQAGKKVTLIGFGTFSVVPRKARTGRNPRTKKALKIPASKAIRFKPGKAMKDAVNNRK